VKFPYEGAIDAARERAALELLNLDCALPADPGCNRFALRHVAGGEDHLRTWVRMPARISA